MYRSGENAISGFTLLELMLVLLVMAVVSGLVVLSGSTSAGRETQSRVVETLPAFVRAVSVHARLRGQTQGMGWHVDGLVHYDTVDNNAAGGPELVRRDHWQLPDGWSVQLEVDQQPVTVSMLTGPPVSLAELPLRVRPDGSFNSAWRVRFRSRDGSALTDWLVSDGVNFPYWATNSE